MTTNTDDSSIPIIDLSRDQVVVAKDLVDAFRTIGFCILVDHGVDLEVVKKGFASSRAFFELPSQTKEQYLYEGHASNRGYLPMGNERPGLETKSSLQSPTTTQPDRKETFEIGKEGEAEYANRWPSELAEQGFKEDMLKYFNTFDQLYLRLMKYLGVGLCLDDPDFFVERCNEQHCNLRLLHYPELKKDGSVPSDEPVIRGARHTDFGTITLLSQDQTGGLRVERRDGTWTFVPPVLGGIVVNVGDMLQRWTNDELRATPHQVVEPPRHTNIIPERYSIAFFCNANKNVRLEAIKEILNGRPSKYPSMTAHEYITRRLADTIDN
jgi:isopenicillin N synthase-like dioxygenase